MKNFYLNIKAYQKFVSKTVSIKIFYLKFFAMSTTETDERFEVERPGELELSMNGLQMIDKVVEFLPIELLGAYQANQTS
jgi:hypothetical protein